MKTGSDRNVAAFLLFGRDLSRMRRRLIREYFPGIDTSYHVRGTRSSYPDPVKDLVDPWMHPDHYGHPYDGDTAQRQISDKNNYRPIIMPLAKPHRKW